MATEPLAEWLPAACGGVQPDVWAAAQLGWRSSLSWVNRLGKVQKGLAHHRQQLAAYQARLAAREGAWGMLTTHDLPPATGTDLEEIAGALEALGDLGAAREALRLAVSFRLGQLGRNIAGRLPLLLAAQQKSAALLERLGEADAAALVRRDVVGCQHLIALQLGNMRDPQVTVQLTHTIASKETGSPERDFALSVQEVHCRAHLNEDDAYKTALLLVFLVRSRLLLGADQRDEAQQRLGCAVAFVRQNSEAGEHRQLIQGPPLLALQAEATVSTEPARARALLEEAVARTRGLLSAPDAGSNEHIQSLSAVTESALRIRHVDGVVSLACTEALHDLCMTRYTARARDWRLLIALYNTGWLLLGHNEALRALAHARAILAVCGTKDPKVTEEKRLLFRLMAYPLAGNALLTLNRSAESVALLQEALREEYAKVPDQISQSVLARELLHHGLASVGDVAGLHAAIADRFRHAAQFVDVAPEALTVSFNPAGLAELAARIGALEPGTAAAVSVALIQAAERLVEILPAEHREKAETNRRLMRDALGG